jgi:hypothetical protein
METEDHSEVSDRTRAAAIPLAVLLGVFGAHRFYVGKTGTGVMMVCTLGGMGLWWLADLILLATGEFRDVEGRRVARWYADAPGPSRSLAASAEVREEMDALRSEMADLAERVDFMERILSKVRERSGLPPGTR